MKLIIFALAWLPHLALAMNLSFPTKEVAARVLTTPDAYLNSLSENDLALRAGSGVSKQAYLDLVAAQTLDWTESERHQITSIVQEIERELSSHGIALNVPSVVFIKTTGREESSAAYTRSNFIVLPEMRLRADLSALVAHELFHVYSRHRHDLRDLLYATAGFTRVMPLPRELETVRYKVLSNPDVDDLGWAIRLQSRGESFLAIPLILRREPFRHIPGPGFLFRELDFKLLRLGNGTLFSPGETDYISAIGANSDYNIHPEEIVAENFSFLATGKTSGVPRPDAIESLRRVLQSAR